MARLFRNIKIVSRATKLEQIEAKKRVTILISSIAGIVVVAFLVITFWPKMSEKIDAAYKQTQAHAYFSNLDEK